MFYNQPDFSFNLSSVHPGPNPWIREYVSSPDTYNVVARGDTINFKKEKSTSDVPSIFKIIALQQQNLHNSPFEKFPIEVWILILQHFSFKEICNLRMVNTGACEIANRLLPIAPHSDLFINQIEIKDFLSSGPYTNQYEAVVLLYQFFYRKEIKCGHIQSVKKLLEKPFAERTIKDLINARLFENKHIEKLENTALTKCQIDYLTSQKFVLERTQNEKFDLDIFLKIPDVYLKEGITLALEELKNINDNNFNKSLEDEQQIITRANVFRFFLNIRNVYGVTPVNYAASTGDIETLIKLINLGANVNISDHDGCTPLHYAAENNIPKMVQILLENGANPHSTDYEGCTPLHHAMHNQHIENTNILIDAMTHFDDLDHVGKTVLQYAVEMKNMDIFMKLIHKKANVHILNKKGRNAFHCAVQVKFTEVYDKFIEAGINIHQTDKMGINALHLAAENNGLEAVEWLIKHQIDINVQDHYGWTAMHYATRKGHEQIVDILLDNKANPNIKNNVTEDTPLHYAAQIGKVSLVRKLLQAGAYSMHRDSQGKTPFYYALRFLHFDIVKVLCGDSLSFLKNFKFQKAAIQA